MQNLPTDLDLNLMMRVNHKQAVRKNSNLTKALEEGSSVWLLGFTLHSGVMTHNSSTDCAFYSRQSKKCLFNLIK